MSFTLDELDPALTFINNLIIPIEPRKKWPLEYQKSTKIEFVNEEGICLSKYGDVGYGTMIKEDKYGPGYYRDEIVGKSTNVLQELIQKNNIRHITNVPSLRNDKVEEFTKRLATKLKINYLNLLDKSDAPPQKEQENSYFQCKNADTSFSVKDVTDLPEKILLVDDIIDSKWTITVCGYKLMEKGIKNVFPFALADSSHAEV